MSVSLFLQQVHSQLVSMRTGNNTKGFHANKQSSSASRALLPSRETVSWAVHFPPLSGFGHGTCHIPRVKLRLPFSPLPPFVPPFSLFFLLPLLSLLFCLVRLVASVIVCVCLFHLRVCQHHVHAWCPWGLEEGVGRSGAGVIDSCEPPHGCWEPNPGPLQEQ